ncbi:MAG TPA: hypothetical protein VLA43_05260, partial [Longimicrobiales bacterium]|nr:hypothetical protein [Longimicrobiales bacterium]
MMEHQEAHDRTANMVRDHYNPPPATPRDEIWSALEARIHATGSPGSTPRHPPSGEVPAAEVIPMEGRWKRGWGVGRWGGPWGVGWAVAAATVALAAGIGVGRWSLGPVPSVESGPVAQAAEGATPHRAAAASRLAAAEHLARTEPLLTLVKGDLARGSVDPAVAEWAGDLLGQTRFLLDSGLPLDPEM